MYKVSIIVPVYNKEEYLRECLDSLINQSFKDIEIICIDDKSTDNSLDILKEYASKDNRIKVITNEINKGLSFTRNVGIEAAEGEFLSFIDADDFVNLDFYQKLCKFSDDFDIIKGEIWDFNTETKKININDICNCNLLIKNSGNPCYFYYGLTSAIYRTSLIKNNNIKFPLGIYYNEDTTFIMLAASKVKEIKVVDNAKYFYRNVPSSLSRQGFAQLTDKFYNSLIPQFEYLKSSNLSYENKAIVARYILRSINIFVNNDYLSIEQLDNLKKEYFSLMGIDINNIKDIKVSIILPIYNAEKYIRHLLDCLTFQSLTDIEIICYDDASTDNSFKIVEEYSKKDPRITAIKSEKDIHFGSSLVRNVYLEDANGEYISFINQTDLVDLTLFEDLYGKAIETQADIVKGNYVEVSNKGSTLIKSGPIEDNPLYFVQGLESAIYRKDFLKENTIGFNENAERGNEHSFLFDACSVCEEISLVTESNYYVMKDNKKHSESSIEELIYNISYILNRVEQREIYEIDEKLYTYLYTYYFDLAMNELENATDFDDKVSLCEFLFGVYQESKCKDIILSNLNRINAPIARYLPDNNINLFIELVAGKAHSDVFYLEANKEITNPIKAEIIVPSNNDENEIDDNPFITSDPKVTVNFLDNSGNLLVTKLLNNYLDSYDYKKESWLIFTNDKFQFLTFPSLFLNNLDKSKIYGNYGVKAIFSGNKVGFERKGNNWKKDENNRFSYNKEAQNDDLIVDTLDSSIVIIHSSLINKFSLRFDENLSSLYVEDLCINAHEKYDIVIEVVDFDSINHSDSEVTGKDQKYLNNKYKDNFYGGAKAPIGGKSYQEMNSNELSIYRIRNKLRRK